ncbi:MAG: putative chitinase [Sphingomonadales bacterium]|jgi:putative chitinase|nr:putative chitinase [Sphingomonadales bacterium]MEA3045383.1 putative chitinase [Sphingomonadales bacterium]
MITKEQLAALFPQSPAPMIAAMAAQIGPLFKEYQIANSANRIHFFMAQIGHESGGDPTRQENLNYSAKRMAEVWPKRYAANPRVKPYTPNALALQLEHKPEALANNVYASRNGNGPPESGDGWRFRGRGLMQLTGRANYRDIGALAGIDLIADPDRAAATADALRVACAFWKSKNVNAVCDTGNFTKVTELVNGATIGLPERQQWLAKSRAKLGANPTVG